MPTGLLFQVFRVCVLSSQCGVISNDQERYLEQTFVNISGCFFSKINVFDGPGGAIYINNGNNMYISYTAFSNIHSTSTGGAIYYQSSISVLKMLCAYKCSSPYCHFGYIEASSINYIEYLSMALCSEFQAGVHPLLFYSGEQRLLSTNSSLNGAHQSSGIDIDSPSSISTFFYCTFSNNKAADSICIHLYGNSATLSYFNIVHNNSPIQLGVVYVGAGSYTLSYCIISHNRDTLLYGSIDIFHSFISHLGITSNTNNNSLVMKSTYQFKFYNTKRCHANNPFITPQQYITYRRFPTSRSMSLLIVTIFAL